MTVRTAAVLVALGSMLLPAHSRAAELPTVRLKTPGQLGDARRPVVTVLAGARDCSAPPTVSIVATWRGRSGRGILVVSGLKRVLQRSPRTAPRSVDRLTFRGVRARRGVSRVAAVLTTDWRTSETGGGSCEVRLPRLVGTGLGASAASRGEVRLRTPLAVRASVAPQRVTSRDQIWSCGGAARFDCGVRVTLASSPSSGTTEQIPAIERVAEETTPCPSGCPTPEPSATPTCTADRTTTTCSANDDEPPDWAKVLLGLLGVAGVGGAGAVARNRSKTDDKKATTTKSWGDIARDEYAKPDEPISARASELSKIGAPVAAAMAAVLAGVGGWVTDAPKGDTIIAIAIILAVAVGGLLYVFATDFKARATVANARFESLAKLVRIEAAATSTVQADADAAKAEAAAATKARDEANVKAADASARQSEAEKRAASYAEPPTPSLPAWVPLAEVSAMVDDEKAVLYGVASAGAEVTHYLAEIPSEGFVWVPKGKVTFPR